MQPEIKSADPVSRVCPLGVRFFDEATGSTVGDGLEVTACPKARWDQALSAALRRGAESAIFPQSTPFLEIAATLNHSGIYVFQNLPGLRGVENGEGDEDFWRGPSGTAARPFVILVRDQEERFLPFTFVTNLPYRGVFNLDCDSSNSPALPVNSPPVSALAHVPLFSAPARQVSGGLAVLRAELWDRARNVPAAWAMVKVTIEDPMRGSVHGRGVADAGGRVLVLFPSPEPQHAFSASPLREGVPLLAESWDVEVEAYYGRLSQGAQFFEACSVLQQQLNMPATLLQSASPPIPLTHARLEYGRDIILKTAGNTDSKLLVT